MFNSNSRYYLLETKFLTTEDGNVIAYKSRRFLPPLNKKSLTLDIIFKEGDRLDLIAARTLGDPLHFWQIADANNVMHPRSLTEQPGNPIHIPAAPFQG